MTDANANTGADDAAAKAVAAAAKKPNEGSGDDAAALRAEAAAYRIESRKERERAEAAEKRAEKVEKDKEKAVNEAKEEGAKSTDKFKERAKDSELKAQAVAAGLEDVDLLPLIKQKHGDKIKMDDEGNITGIDEAIAAFKEEKPVYFKDGKKDKDADVDEKKPPRKTGSEKNPPGDKNPKPKKARDMEPKEYAEYKRNVIDSLKK